MKKLGIFTILLLIALAGLTSGCVLNQVNIKYVVFGGGQIVGEQFQTLRRGDDAEEVTAIASEGYEFVCWSDGVETATRRDLHVKKNMEVCAVFNLQYCSFAYRAEFGGNLRGASQQTVLYGHYSEPVTAVPAAGYHFVGWSDGNTKATRTDCGVQSDTELVARFEINTYLVCYQVGEIGGGRIIGETRQLVLYGDPTQKVRAQADPEYEFVGWSDGFRYESRQEYVVTEHVTILAIFRKVRYPVEYRVAVNGGGFVEGETVQSVASGEDAQTVRAVPEENCRFIGWSDGVLTAERTEQSVRQGITVTASFERDVKTFSYEYNGGTAERSPQNVTIERNRLSETEFVIPQKRSLHFGGWYLEPDFLTKAVDESGNYLLGYMGFDAQTDCLYARWQARDDVPTYKILLVMVDEIHATLKSTDGVDVAVDYKMSAIERMVCALMPRQFADCLNDWFDGKVRFEVDVYFTTTPMGKENFSSGDNAGKRTYSLMAYDLPEVAHLLDRYRSIATYFGMNDYQNLLHSVGGLAEKKYAALHIESCWRDQRHLEDMIQDDYNWDYDISGYLHEFTHTIEQGMSVYEFHKAIVYASNHGLRNNKEIIRLYLLNQLEIEGEKVGIPFSYWFS